MEEKRTGQRTHTGLATLSIVCNFFPFACSVLVVVVALFLRSVIDLVVCFVYVPYFFIPPILTIISCSLFLHTALFYRLTFRFDLVPLFFLFYI